MIVRALTVGVIVMGAVVLWLLALQSGDAVLQRRRRRQEPARQAARAALIGTVVANRLEKPVVVALRSLPPAVCDEIVCSVAVEVRSHHDPIFAELAMVVGLAERIDRDLGARRWWIRRAAARRALAVGLDSDRVTELFDDVDPRVRATAVTWLAAVAPGRESADVIVRMLDDGDQRVRRAAMTALHGLGSAAQPAVIRALGRAEGDLLRPTITVAAVLDDPVVAGSVWPFLEVEDPATKAEAIRAVTPILTTEDAEFVESLLLHEDSRVRAAAAAAAGTAGMREVAGAVARNLDSPDGPTREAAIEALERLGSAGDLLLRRAARATVVGHG